MGTASNYGLEQHGLKPVQTVHWNLSPAELVEQAVRRGEGQLTQDSPIVVITKPHTGRSPNDKYIVREPSSADQIWWAKNGALSEEQFDRLREYGCNIVQGCYVGRVVRDDEVAAMIAADRRSAKRQAS